MALILLGALWLSLIPAGIVRGSPDAAPSKEFKVKAAFLINFGQFIEWPEGALPADQSSFIIAIVGEDPFGEMLDNLCANKTIRGHSIEIKRYSSPDQIERCHLLYIASDQQGNLSQIFDKIKNKPVLTVGESDEMLEASGIIRFLIEDNKIHFEVNTEAAQQSGLHISSKLLKLARIFSK